MNMFTRRGDEGLTDLANGERIKKTDIRIETIGLLDELNSYIGLLISQMLTALPDSTEYERAQLQHVQRRIFSIGSAVAGGQSKNVSALTPADVEEIEKFILRLAPKEEKLFRGFVLPGGHPVAAFAHVVRCQCRHTEIILHKCLASPESCPVEKAYINRISDLMYAIARKINNTTAFEENMW